MKQIRITKQGALKGLLFFALVGNISWPIYMRSADETTDQSSVAPGAVSYDLGEIKDGNGGTGSKAVGDTDIPTTPEDRKVVSTPENAVRVVRGPHSNVPSSHCGLDLNLEYQQFKQKGGKYDGQQVTSIVIKADVVAGETIDQQVVAKLTVPGTMNFNVTGDRRELVDKKLILPKVAEFQGEHHRSCSEYAEMKAAQDEESSTSSSRRRDRDNGRSRKVAKTCVDKDALKRVDCFLKRIEDASDLDSDEDMVREVARIVNGDFGQLLRNSLVSSNSTSRRGSLSVDDARDALHSAIDAINDLPVDSNNMQVKALVRKLTDMEIGGGINHKAKAEYAKASDLIQQIRDTKASFGQMQNSPQAIAQMQMMFGPQLSQLQQEIAPLVGLTRALQAEGPSYVPPSDFSLYAAPIVPLQNIPNQNYQQFSVSQLGAITGTPTVPGIIGNQMVGSVGTMGAVGLNGRPPIQFAPLPVFQRGQGIGAPGMIGAQPGIGAQGMVPASMMANPNAALMAQQNAAFAARGLGVPLNPGGMYMQPTIFPTQAPLGTQFGSSTLDGLYN